jgi:RNA polymerase sigma-70 factor (ECF subfamily)
MSERRQLINLAYRLLGSLAEAEDVVQETYARWYAMSRQQQEPSNPRRLADHGRQPHLPRPARLGTGPAERYVGEWIPEPLPEPRSGSRAAGGATADPADRVTLDESVNMAFLVVLESMTPAERVAFILHDVFRYSFTEIAGIVGRTPQRAASWPPQPAAASVPRSLSRPRQPSRPASSGPSRRHGRPRDIDALIVLLDPDATAIADGGVATTFLRPIEGGEQIARAWIEIAARAPSNMTFLERTVNGQPGLVAQQDGVTRDGVRVRRRRRPDQAHLGRAQPPRNSVLDHRLTRVLPSRSGIAQVVVDEADRD